MIVDLEFDSPSIPGCAIYRSLIQRYSYEEFA